MGAAAAVLACTALAALWSYTIRRDVQGPMKMPDFSGVYFGTRCVIYHRNPYDERQYEQELGADNTSFLHAFLGEEQRTGIRSPYVYPPTAMFALLPLAALPWAVAQNLWMALTAAALGLAAWLMCDLGAGDSSALCGVLACFLLLNCTPLLLLGNPAGIAVGFCMIAAWCFLKERYAPAGVALLALSLAIKPHDAGLVWLYFLLAGGALRKRALQTLAVTAALGICAVAWIMPAAPHWMQAERSDLAAAAAPGGSSNPGTAELASGANFSTMVSLQAAFSIVKADPRFYDPMSYAIGGGLILAWAIAVLRKRLTPGGSLLALAAVAMLTMLPVYHRAHDAKLLLLAVPACALLWAGKGARRWAALALTTAAIVATSELPLLMLSRALGRMNVTVSTPSGKMILLLMRPAPLLLLAAGGWFLWAYARTEGRSDQGRRD